MPSKPSDVYLHINNWFTNYRLFAAHTNTNLNAVSGVMLAFAWTPSAGMGRVGRADARGTRRGRGVGWGADGKVLSGLGRDSALLTS